MKKCAYGNGNLAKWGNVQTLPPEAMETLFAEMRRIRKRYGRWELVDIQSKDGESVQIIL